MVITSFSQAQRVGSFFSKGFFEHSSDALAVLSMFSEMLPMNVAALVLGQSRSASFVYYAFGIDSGVEMTGDGVATPGVIAPKLHVRIFDGAECAYVKH